MLSGFEMVVEHFRRSCYSQIIFVDRVHTVVHLQVGEVTTYRKELSSKAHQRSLKSLGKGVKNLYKVIQKKKPLKQIEGALTLFPFARSKTFAFRRIASAGMVRMKYS